MSDESETKKEPSMRELALELGRAYYAVNQIYIAAVVAPDLKYLRLRIDEIHKELFGESGGKVGQL